MICLSWIDTLSTNQSISNWNDTHHGFGTMAIMYNLQVSSEGVIWLVLLPLFKAYHHDHTINKGLSCISSFENHTSQLDDKSHHTYYEAISHFWIIFHNNTTRN